MKKPRLTSLLTAATLFLVLGAAGARAQEAATPPPPAPPATGEAAEQSLRQRLEKDPRFLARADTDHDGKISDAEWAAAKARFKAMRDQHGPGFAGRPDDRRDPAFRRGYLLGKYDKNGDGRLDETERAAMRADMEARLRRHMEKELARLKAIDTDGDGKISDAEWAAAKARFKNARPGHRRGPGGPGPAPDEAAPDGPPPPAPPAE